MSVIASALILVIAYWRLHHYGLDIGWSTLALLLSGLNLAAAANVARRRNGAFEIEIALAAYAVGVLGGTILAATFALSAAWLTVAIALHLPAIGWVEGRMNLKVLRWVAAVLAGIVLVRLALNPYVLDYPHGGADLQLAALRLRRAGGGLCRRDAPVRQPRRRSAGAACSKPAALLLDHDAPDLRAAPCALWRGSTRR